MKLSPEMIREQRFRTRFKGFDRQEVTAFLLDLAEDMESLIEENSLLKGEIEEGKKRQREIEDMILSLRQFTEERMKMAESESSALVDKAERRASEIQEAASRKMAEAEQRAQEVLAQAMRKAKEMLRDAERARQEAERSLEEISERRKAMLEQLRTVVDSCRAWIDAHVVQ
ncbi:MAG TPA: DivIVA domain-containing protein [Deltaproteobacteria bacterium]|nr:DivIVA domain-containing protein [Deltaproteobacteria bacterium]HOM28548.1 DivIVA domain-containing protein [Deltaproteobacteria bacterium]HPP79535.1 DivIVA domain-containing protein [Deltaproteobacteria bacterium]